MTPKDIADIASKVSKTMIAYVHRQGKQDFAAQLRHERYQRTFTDEYVDKYLFGRKPRPGSEFIRQKYGEE